MKKTFLLLTGLFGCLLSRGQAYDFSKESGTYTELVNPHVISTSWTKGSATYMKFDNLDVRVFNQTYRFDSASPLALGFNGFLAGTNDTTAFALDAFLTYMESLPTGSSISYLVAPDVNMEYVMKFQWKNAHPSKSLAGEYLNYQIWLYTKSGDVEYHIGPGTVSVDSAFEDGPAFGVFLADQNFARVYSTNFLDGDAANPFVNTTEVFATINGIPGNGTIYRFKNRSVNANITDPKNLQFKAYPNPATNTLNITADQQTQGAIYDLLGKEILKFDLAIGINSLDITSLSPGNYVLKVGEVSTQKLIRL